MSKLAVYLEQSKMTQAALAAELGVTQPTIHRWITGQAKPNWEKAAALERITEGAVPLSFWAGDHIERSASTPINGGD